ncbi:MAG: phosphotransferase, partial [Actinobacteria bacterium]|nr:phosphotransferase [Actinomycetota bacterium]
TDVLLWGGAAVPPAPAPAAFWSAVRREAALLALRGRGSPPFEIRGVHRLPPPLLRGSSARSRVRAAVLQGVVVEMAVRAGELRVVDAVANAAGARECVSGLRLGSGGTALAFMDGPDGTRVLLRAGASVGALPVANSADALEHLSASRVGRVPRLMARGETCGASWSTESVVGGHRPKQLSPQLIKEAIAFCLRLPRCDRATAVRTDIGVIAERVPEVAAPLTVLGARLQEECAGLPGVMRHGDMWAGNLLVNRGNLAGVIDWDAWHPEGLPGTDVMYLMVAEQWLRKRRDLGGIWAERPWRSAHFQAVTADYWVGFGIEPRSGLLDAIGIASWAAQASANLARSPQLADNPRWIENNVLAPSSAFSTPGA